MAEIFDMKDEYQKLDAALKEAEKDDTPFLVTTEDEMNVVGDANKTEIKSQDYTLTFRFPKGTKLPEAFTKISEGNSGVRAYKEYKDFFITPRKNMNVIRLLINILPFFRKQEEDGSVTSYTEEEVMGIVGSLTDEIIDAMYQLIAYVFELNTAIAECVEPMCVAQMVIRFIRDYPEAVNEADTFFDSSAQNQ